MSVNTDGNTMNEGIRVEQDVTNEEEFELIWVLKKSITRFMRPLTIVINQVDLYKVANWYRV